MGKGACVCAFASKECVFGKGTCSLSDTEGNAEVFAFVSVGADKKANARAAAHLRLVSPSPLSAPTLRLLRPRANSSLFLMARMPVVTSPSPLDARAELPALLAAIDSDPSTRNSPR